MANSLLPSDMSRFGPLAFLIGSWEGSKGDDKAPDSKRGVEKNLYREQMTFSAMSPVDNHEQTLAVLRYQTTAWRIGAADPFHEELGYWHWDAQAGIVMRSFMPPRGMAILAGGKAQADSQYFEMESNIGAEVFGVSSSPFLNQEFKTVKYLLKITKINQNEFTYWQNTQLLIKGQKEIFDHIDSNKLNRLL